MAISDISIVLSVDCSICGGAAFPSHAGLLPPGIKRTGRKVLTGAPGIFGKLGVEGCFVMKRYLQRVNVRAVGHHCCRAQSRSGIRPPVPPVYSRTKRASPVPVE